MNKTFLGTTKNGFSVYIDEEASHALTHFAKKPELRDAVIAHIPSLEPDVETYQTDIDTGSTIGTSDLVETTDESEIVYAKRPIRSIYSRFAKNTKPTPTSWITIALKKKGGDYWLHTAFVGKEVPSFPGGDYRPDESREFWSKHALVWGSQDIVPGTETTKCPW